MNARGQLMKLKFKIIELRMCENYFCQVIFTLALFQTRRERKLKHLERNKFLAVTLIQCFVGNFRVKRVIIKNCLSTKNNFLSHFLLEKDLDIENENVESSKPNSFTSNQSFLQWRSRRQILQYIISKLTLTNVCCIFNSNNSANMLKYLQVKTTMKLRLIRLKKSTLNHVIRRSLCINCIIVRKFKYFYLAYASLITLKL